jgi:hypothetical protein
LKLKETHCPICSKELEIKCHLIFDYFYCNSFECSSEKEGNLLKRVNYKLVTDYMTSDVEIDLMSGAFKFNVIENNFPDSKLSDSTAIMALNNYSVNLFQECDECEYIINYNYFKFDSLLFKINKISVWSEQINLKNYKIYNDFKAGKTHLYFNDNDTDSNVKSFDEIFDFKKNNPERWIKERLIFG